jgi:hypothetical protein
MIIRKPGNLPDIAIRICDIPAVTPASGPIVSRGPRDCSSIAGRPIEDRCDVAFVGHGVSQHDAAQPARFRNVVWSDMIKKQNACDENYAQSWREEECSLGLDVLAASHELREDEMVEMVLAAANDLSKFLRTLALEMAQNPSGRKKSGKPTDHQTNAAAKESSDDVAGCPEVVSRGNGAVE